MKARIIGIGRLTTFVSLLCLASRIAEAQKTWIGVDSNMQTAGNWSPSGVPGTGEAIARIWVAEP